MNVHQPVPAANRIVTRNDNAPGQIELARETWKNVNAFLAETPVILTPDEAKTAARWLESTRKTIEDIEAERTAQVKPLNDQVEAINEPYRAPRKAIERLLAVLKERLNAFTKAEEAKRAAEAQRLRLEAEAAEAAARAAEAAEQDAIACADTGVLDVDVGAAIETADEIFSTFKHAARAAARAEQAIPVRFGSTFGGRALSMRSKETLVLENAVEAVRAIAKVGISEKLREAILADARAFKKLKGELPKGITSTTDRSL